MIRGFPVFRDREAFCDQSTISARMSGSREHKSDGISGYGDKSQSCEGGEEAEIQFASGTSLPAVRASERGLRKFTVCRICFRNLALDGLIPGVKKASW